MNLQRILGMLMDNGDIPTVEISELIPSETAWCYLHGIGTKKNAKMAARYYRMAEKQGVKGVGLSWIWKEKYDEKEGEGEGKVRRAATDELPRPTTLKRGKSLFSRKNTA